jgi:prepilin-type N-terminal cleavage/methylation domain-containing protein
MTTARIARKRNQLGFTLIETMVALAVFVVICGAIFKLLDRSQQRYHTESQVLDSLQDARLGMDQIVRDASDAGYPPYINFANVPVASNCVPTTPCSAYVNSPVAWSPGYIALNPCQIGTAGGGTCNTPGDFDVIFEEEPDNAVPANTIQWVRYALQGTTLYRGTATKTNGSAVAQVNFANNSMFPYVYNVVNNDTAANIASYRAAYPTMFPGGNPVPIFQFYCANPAANPPTILCQNAGANNSPTKVVDVEITLIVNTPQRDAQNNALHLVELNGRGHVINPL